MDHEDERPGWVRLPGSAQQDRGAPPAVAGRSDGIRRARIMSNWTAAALIAGVAAVSGYFAHHTTPATATAGPTTQALPSGQVLGAGHAAAAGPHRAAGPVPVATSGGSGVAMSPASGAAGTGGGPAATVTWRDN